MQLLVGLVLAGAVGLIAYRRGMLSLDGVLAAVAVGTLTFSAGFEWAMLVIAFFVSSSLLSRLTSPLKEQARQQFDKDEQRDFGQVFANGGVATLCALAFLLTDDANWWAAFAGALATATADTWATEIGTLGRQKPRLITTFKTAPMGTSGGVTLNGTLGALAGAFLIGTMAAASADALRLLMAVTCGGFVGMVADSLLGATLQAQYLCDDHLTERRICDDGSKAALQQGLRVMTNDRVNLLATGCGAVVSLLLI